MNAIKTVILPILIAGGTITALAFAKVDETTSKNDSKQATLYWFDQSSTPGYLRSNTIPNEETASGGCEYPLKGCERGYSSSQLNNAANPSAGVKPSEVNNPTATLGRP